MKPRSVRAWAVMLNGKYQWSHRQSDYEGKDLILYFCRNQASYEWGTWHHEHKIANRRFILNKGVRLVKVEIRPIKPRKKV